MKRKPALLYLTGSSLSLQQEKEITQTFSFPPSLIAEETPHDTKALVTFFRNALYDLEERASEVIIIIGSGLLYQFAVEVGEADREDKRENFLKDLPFERDDIILKTILTEKRVYTLATSKSYLSALSSACHDHGFSPVAIVPLSLFSNEAEQNTLSEKEIKEILKKRNIYRQADFLTELASVSVMAEAEETVLESVPTEGISAPLYRVESGWNTSRLVLLLGFLIVVTGLVYAALFLYPQAGQETTVADDPAPTATPSPTPDTVSKEALSIQVLNGTGIPGQAGLVKTSLEEKGFTNVTAGNSEEQRQTETLVVFSERISEEDKQQVMDALEELFATVTTKTDPTAITDITITTGTQL